MRWRAAVAVLVIPLLIGSVAPSVYAQTAEEMRKQVQDMRKMLETQEKRLQQLESEQSAQQAQQKKQEVQQQKQVETAIRQALEAQPPQVTLGPPPMPPSLLGLGIFGSVDFQWVGFKGIDTIYVGEKGNGSETPIGRLRSVDVERTFAPRYTLGVYLPKDWGILSANYMHVEADGKDQYTNTSDGVFNPNSFPYACDTGDCVMARAKNRVTLDQLDVQWQYPVLLTRRLVLTPELGVRAIWFNQSVRADYYDDAGEIQVHQAWKNATTAVGPKIGLGAGVSLPWNLTLNFKGSGGYLLGDNTPQAQFCRGSNFGTPGCATVHNFTTTADSRGIPFVDGDFSLGYTFGANTALKGLSVFAGYRIATFFDLTTNIQEFSNSGEPLTMTFGRRNLTTDAAYFGLQYIF